MKRKRILTSAEISATEFTSISFATSADKLLRFLVTLTNKCSDGNFRIVIWLWDKQRLVTHQVVKVDNAESVPQTVSFNPEDPRVVVVTGKNIYRYNKLTNNNQLNLTHDKLIKKENLYASSFTTHAWI